MSRFVPVTDVEKPRSEQDARALSKHANFSALNVAESREDCKRGWATGSVGWGVRGTFGGAGADSGAQVRASSTASGGNKLVQDERGRWVKQKDFDRAKQQHQQRRGGGGGRGPSQASPLSYPHVGSPLRSCCSTAAPR